MRKLSLTLIYVSFIVLFMSMAVTSTYQSVKFGLGLILAAMLYMNTVGQRQDRDLTTFNMLFFGTSVAFLIYGSVFRGTLYHNILLQLFVAALVGFVLMVSYKPRLKLRAPKKPEPRVVVEDQVVTTPIVAQKVTKKPAAKKTAAKKKKTTKKKTAKKTTKKSTRKAAKKSSKKKTASKKNSKKSVAKKKATNTRNTSKGMKGTRKSAKKSTRKASKASKKRSIVQDRNLISFNEKHEVNYILRKFNRRTTAANRALLEKAGDRFNGLKSYAPHNRESFYKYMKKNNIVRKLEK